MKRLPYILGLALLVVSIGYAINTTLQVVKLNSDWKRCTALMSEVGGTCNIEYHKYGQEVIHKKGEITEVK